MVKICYFNSIYSHVYFATAHDVEWSSSPFFLVGGNFDCSVTNGRKFFLPGYQDFAYDFGYLKKETVYPLREYFTRVVCDESHAFCKNDIS